MNSKKMNIIYEDKNILVVNKPAGLLTIATDKEKIKTLYHQAYDYVHKKNRNNKIFIVHRLDKDTSGIVLFAKNEQIKKYLQDNWNTLASVREYYCIVEGQMKNKKGHIEQYITDDKNLYTYVTDKKHGHLAITDYEVIRSSKNYSILKVNIKTGRKNQIRVALSNLNHPIIGDKKYGSTKNPLRKLCLHHEKLIIKMPDKEMTFIAKIPPYYKIFQ